MKYSQLVILMAVLFSGEEAHAYPSSVSPSRGTRKSRSVPSSGKRRRRRKRTITKPKPSRKLQITEFQESDLLGFPVDADDQKEEERILSALERIDRGVMIDSKKPKRGDASSKGETHSPTKNKRDSPPMPTGSPSPASASPVTVEVRTGRKHQHPSSVTERTRTLSSGKMPESVGLQRNASVKYASQRKVPSVSAAKQIPVQIQPQDFNRAMLSYTTPWVAKFVQARPHDVLLAVPRDFLGDGFNLVHLPPVIERLGGSNDSAFPLYKAALRVILSTEEIQDVPPSVQLAAEILYSLVHARYIISPRGLDTVRRLLIHDKAVFGKCPRPTCRGMPMLPHGESTDYTGQQNAQRYCCSCGQVWEFWDSKVDGSAWGPSFCHLFLLTYGNRELGRTSGHVPQNPSTVPTVFGFRVHMAALRRLHEP